MKRYLEDARRKLLEEGGFTQWSSDASAPHGAGWLFRRDEEERTTLVALLPMMEDDPLRSFSEWLLDQARMLANERGVDAQAILLVVTREPLTVPEFQRMQQYTAEQDGVSVVPWVADLARGRIFENEGPPYGADPSLAQLLTPEPMPRPAYGGVQPQAVRPVLTVVLIGLIVGVWLLMTIDGGSLEATERSSQLLSSWGAVVRPDMWQSGEYWRLLTATFVHIGFTHLLLNSISLWYVGSSVEFLFGRWRLLFLFLISGVAGSVFSAMFGAPVVLSAGASGAIFGLLGAIIWYRIASPVGGRIAWAPLLSTLAINLGFGLFVADNVDNWNHIGGLIGGFIGAMLVGVPAIPGFPAPRFNLPRALQALAVTAAGGLAVLLLTGVLVVPGMGKDVAHAFDVTEAGRPREAEPILRRAVARQPDQPLLHYYLFWVLSETGECEEAEEELETVFSLVPDFPSSERTALRELLEYCH